MRGRVRVRVRGRVRARVRARLLLGRVKVRRRLSGLGERHRWGGYRGRGGLLLGAVKVQVGDLLS